MAKYFFLRAGNLDGNRSDSGCSEETFDSADPPRKRHRQKAKPHQPQQQQQPLSAPNSMERVCSWSTSMHGLFTVAGTASCILVLTLRRSSFPFSLRFFLQLVPNCQIRPTAALQSAIVSSLFTGLIMRALRAPCNSSPSQLGLLVAPASNCSHLFFPWLAGVRATTSGSGSAPDSSQL